MESLPVSERPNVLLITTDQQRFDTIHAAGNESIYTPHLNWLCDEGVRFDRAYTDCPICIPARVTIMTGEHAHTHRTVVNSGAKLPLKDRTTLPGVLTAHGYQTHAQGKMHFHPNRAHYGFEQMELTADYLRQMRREGRLPHADCVQGMGANEMEPVISLADEAYSLARWTVDRSIDFLETRDWTRPFFLWTSFFDPHPPFEPGRRFWELYRDVELPPMAEGDWSRGWEEISPTLRRPSIHLSGCHRFGPAQWRASRRAYYALITQIDYALGLLFGRLNQMDLLEDTWIIFTSDHGEMLGDHGMGAKATALESVARVPMLLRPPRNATEFDPVRGTVSDRLVCLADIMPSCLEMAGVQPREAAPGMDGGSLLGAARGETLRERLFMEVRDNHAVLDSTWKYLFCRSDGTELLFNVAEDPYETRNLLEERPGVAAEYRACLAAHVAEHHPEAVRGDQLVATGPAVALDHFSTRRHPSIRSRDDATYLA
jgi:arylsulfatase A-like enzyme